MEDNTRNVSHSTCKGVEDGVLGAITRHGIRGRTAEGASEVPTRNEETVKDRRERLDGESPADVLKLL